MLQWYYFAFTAVSELISPILFTFLSATRTLKLVDSLPWRVSWAPSLRRQCVGRLRIENACSCPRVAPGSAGGGCWWEEGEVSWSGPWSLLCGLSIRSWVLPRLTFQKEGPAPPVDFLVPGKVSRLFSGEKKKLVKSQFYILSHVLTWLDHLKRVLLLFTP